VYNKYNKKKLTIITKIKSFFQLSQRIPNKNKNAILSAIVNKLKNLKKKTLEYQSHQEKTKATL
jgi:DNA replication protein DnaC